MEEIVFTPRLKLTLVKSLEDGSLDLEWAHIVRSDEKATSWRSVTSLPLILFLSLGSDFCG